METTRENFLQVYEDAKQMEIDGRQFYLQAAATVKSAAVRQALEYLAEAEKYHIEKFDQIYGSLTQDPRWTEAMAAFEPVPCNPNVFKKALKVRGEAEQAEYDYDLQALESCLLLEQKGIDCYTRQAKEASNPLCRRFFESIAQEELDHYNTIWNLKKCLENEVSGSF